MAKTKTSIYSVARENRIARQEELRQKLQGIKYLGALDEIDAELKLGTKTITVTRKKRVKRKMRLVTEEVTLPLNQIDVARLRARAEIQRMRLNKVLPDLKQVEIENTNPDQDDWVLRRARERGLLGEQAETPNEDRPPLNS